MTTRKVKTNSAASLPTALLLGLCIVFSSHSAQTKELHPLLTGVVETLVDSLEGQTSTTLSELRKEHLRRLRLLDVDGQDGFIDEIDHDLGSVLIGSESSVEDAIYQIEEMAYLILENTYLLNFLDAIQDRDFSALKENVEKDGGVELRKIITYALIQQELTSAMKNSPDGKLIRALLDHWSERREVENVKEYWEAFDYLKTPGVENPIKGIVHFHESGEVDPNFLRRGKWSLSSNIRMAMAAEREPKWAWSVFFRPSQKLHPGNIFAGAMLATHKTGVKRLHKPEIDPFTGQGPASWSEDGSEVLIRPPLAKEWADLYQTWNMAFVYKHYGYYPYLFVKLMIPQVANYSNNPEAYMYNRALALYTHLHSGYFARVDAESISAFTFDWRDSEIVELWGEVNKASAIDYSDKVEQATVQRTLE